MKKLMALFARTLLASLLCLTQAAVQAGDASFSEAELDQMLAPIALYPDSLLAQILMATTYPADVAEAVIWSKDNPDQDGDAAVDAVQEKSWDPSVMSLVAFPQVLAMMGEQPDWVQNVGDAFLADSDGVMDTVQKLRLKAKEAGNLETTEQQKVIVEQAPSSTETVIIIEPADPQIVYVPAYNPTIIYGTWWWPRYTPWYYQPIGYGFGSAVVRGIGFGIGIGITNALWGGCHWGRGHGSVDINVNRYNNINVNRNKIDVNKKTTNWNHNSSNRRGVPYRDEKSRKQFENKRAGADERKDYRGRDEQRDKARATLDKRGVDPAEGRKELKGAGGEKARESVSKANRDVAQGKLASRDTGVSRDAAKGVNRDQVKGAAANRDTAMTRDTASKKAAPSRDNALKGAGNAQKERQSINRGQSSNRSMSNRSAGGRAGGGGGLRR
jgi:Protein of unknown function (DUF3300)